MNDEELLLRSICNEPEDDTARLIYADWLQENGEESRADFIRNQITLHREFVGMSWKDKRSEGYYEAAMTGFDPKWRGFQYPKGFPNKSEFWEKGFLWECKWEWTFFWSDQERLKQVFGRHPIRRLWITDREPLPFVGMPSGYAFRVCEPAEGGGEITPALAHWLPSGSKVRRVGKDYIDFRSVIFGSLALSIATVRYARALVGLRDLTEKERFPPGRKK